MIEVTGWQLFIVGVITWIVTFYLCNYKIKTNEPIWFAVFLSGSMIGLVFIITGIKVYPIEIMMVVP